MRTLLAATVATVLAATALAGVPGAAAQATSPALPHLTWRVGDANLTVTAVPVAPLRNVYAVWVEAQAVHGAPGASWSQNLTVGIHLGAAEAGNLTFIGPTQATLLVPASGHNVTAAFLVRALENRTDSVDLEVYAHAAGIGERSNDTVVLVLTFPSGPEELPFWQDPAFVLLVGLVIGLTLGFILFGKPKAPRAR